MSRANPKKRKCQLFVSWAKLLIKWIIKSCRKPK